MGTKSLPGQRHPGGVPWVNSALWCGGSPVRNPGGTPIVWPLPFRGDRLETKKGARELGLMNWSPKDDAVIPCWVTIKNCACCCRAFFTFSATKNPKLYNFFQTQPVLHLIQAPYMWLITLTSDLKLYEMKPWLQRSIWILSLCNPITFEPQDLVQV